MTERFERMLAVETPAAVPAPHVDDDDNDDDRTPKAARPSHRRRR